MIPTISTFVSRAHELIPGLPDDLWAAVASITNLADAMTPLDTVVEGTVSSAAQISPKGVFVSHTASVEPGAYIEGPSFVGPGVQVRHGAYIRGGVILLDGAVLGHASEAKDSLFFPGAKAPHFAYVGNSILGEQVNLGAGTKLSNLQVTSSKNAEGRRSTIEIVVGDRRVDTGLTKVGAVIGDYTQTGCNSVLNLGACLGRDSLVYPNLSIAGGIYPPRTIFKLRQVVELADRDYR